jgi:hypothetical protein
MPLAKEKGYNGSCQGGVKDCLLWRVARRRLVGQAYWQLKAGADRNSVDAAAVKRKHEDTAMARSGRQSAK